jgi:peptide/nickel transport system permease protein
VAGVGAILARRAIILTIALVIIVLLTGVIMEATGYSEKVWEAIIQGQLRAYQMRLRQHASGGSYCKTNGTELVQQYQPSIFSKTIINNKVVLKGSLSYSVSSSSPLKYLSSKHPPGLPKVVITNITLPVVNGKTVPFNITMILLRPDGVNFTLNILTISKHINASAYGVINGTIKSGLTQTIGSNTKLALKDLEEFVVKKITHGKPVNISQSDVPKYVYSTITYSNGKIKLSPLYGDYKIILLFTYPKVPGITTPGDSLTLRVSPPTQCWPISELVQQKKRQLEKFYGLDKPWYVRVGPLVVRTLIGDLGLTNSQDVVTVAGVQSPAKVWDVIMIVMPRTIVMLTVAEIICMIIAIPLAPKIAYHYGTKLDRAVVSYAALFNAIPVWWLAMVFIFAFAYEIHIFPPTGMAVVYYINHFWKNPLNYSLEIMYYAALPIITIVICFLGGWLYSVRAVVLRIVREDYVTVAKAKGLPESMIVRKYIVRVAAPPIVTYVILGLAGSIGGMIITESVFDWPGMGTLYYAAIMDGDVATILGLTYVTTLIYIIARWLLEALYVWLDPRVRYR